MFNKVLLESLNSNQKKLIKWLNNNRDFVLEANISDVAKEMNVSISFVTKTLNKMSYGGWKDYKGFIKNQKYEEVDVKNQKYEERVERSLFNSISRSIKNIDELDIVDIASIIGRNDRDVYFIGEGFSFFIALDQRRRYNKEGIRCFAINAIDYIYKPIKKGDLVIFITASGYTESFIKTHKDLTLKGVDSYVLTTNPAIVNKYKNVVSGVIIDSINRNERELPLNSRIVLLTILDWIYTKVQKLREYDY